MRSISVGVGRAAPVVHRCTTPTRRPAPGDRRPGTASTSPRSARPGGHERRGGQLLGRGKTCRMVGIVPVDERHQRSGIGESHGRPRELFSIRPAAKRSPQLSDNASDVPLTTPAYPAETRKASHPLRIRAVQFARKTAYAGTAKPVLPALCRARAPAPLTAFRYPAEA